MKIGFDRMNENIAKAYCDNCYDRREVVTRRTEIWDKIPINVPMTAEEIGEIAKYHIWGETLHTPSPQMIAQLFKTMASCGMACISKKRLDEPIKIPHREYGWRDNVWASWEEPIIVETINVYTRLI